MKNFKVKLALDKFNPRMKTSIWEQRKQPKNFKLTGKEHTDYRDFLGRQLNIGDTVLYTQKKFKDNRLFAYGVIESLGDCMFSMDGRSYDSPWPYSVVVKRYKARSSGKYQERFPCYCKELIKVSPKELTIMILENGNSDFMRK